MPSEQVEQHRTREAVLSAGIPGSRPGTLPRQTIAASWQRVWDGGLQPGSTPEVPPLGGVELERRRAESGLAPYLPRLTETLRSVVDAGQLVVVADPDGRVLWRFGSSGVRRMADSLGFVGGSAWTEGNVGTNAIGTSLVLGEAVHIQGPEHFVDSHTLWGCAAAPLRNPWSGRTLGVVDVSGPSRGMHPAELALVEAAVRLVEMEMVAHRRVQLDRLRARAAPLLATMTGEVLAVDADGHLAAAVGSRAPDRVALPEHLTAGAVWLPTLGPATAEPLDDGWLLRLGGEQESATALVLDLVAEPCLRVSGPSGDWSRRLSPRHAEILLALLDAGPEGRTSAQLAEDLFADPGPVVTVRAEMSRLRRAVGSLLLSGPYRLSPAVTARVELPADASAALPGSSAPVVRRLRASR